MFKPVQETCSFSDMLGCLNMNYNILFPSLYKLEFITYINVTLLYYYPLDFT